MFKGIKLDSFLKSNIVAGVEYRLKGDDISINAIVLKKKKNLIDIAASKENVKSATELKSIIAENIPLQLSIHGKGIIYRKVSLSENDNEISLLQKVFPNANAGDFYIQLVNIDESSAWITVARKSIIDPVLKEFKASGHKVISCILGPLCFAPLVQWIETQGLSGEIQLNDYFIKTDKNIILDIEEITNSTEKFNEVYIAGMPVKTPFLFSFAGAFTYFIGNNPFTENITPVVEERKEFHQQRIFQLIGVGAMTFFFAIMIANYFVFQHFSSERNALADNLAVNENTILEYERLKKELSQKESFLKKTGLLKTSKNSFYADRLAAELPISLQLTEISIHPVLKKANEENKILFKSDTILVSGFCIKNTDLYEWLNNLKTKKWVSNAVLINYSMDKTENAGAFNIGIKTR